MVISVKKILLLSDTHSHCDDAMLSQAARHDEIWHAGDWGAVEVYDRLSQLKPLRGVYGNIDGQALRLTCPEELLFPCEGFLVYMRHICGYPEHYNPTALRRIRESQPGIVVAGHSHILKVMYDQGLQHLHLNPGAAGRHGFHKVRTMLSFVLDASDIREMKVLEYPK